MHSDGKYVVVYTGTTLENFKKCAFLDGDKIWFDKLREPAHQHRKTYYDERFNIAASFALDCANGRTPEHLPLVMRGRLLEDCLSYSSLDEGELFSVNGAYTPSGKIDWHKLLTSPMTLNIRMFFMETNPRELLSQ